MRYRTLTASGDYSFGENGANFLVNSPEAVGQAVLTRLKLIEGEWFLDQTVGVPYNTEILGAGTGSTRDLAFQTVILETQGVTGIVEYASYLSPTREFIWAATIDTIYGTTTISNGT